MVVYVDSTYSQVQLADGSRQGMRTPVPISVTPYARDDDHRNHLSYPNPPPRRETDPRYIGGPPGRAVDKPQSFGNRMCNKPEKEPVPGSTPAKILSGKVNKIQSASLQTNDIVGASLSASFIVMNPRNTNPNVPVYKLPTHVPAPPMENKFVKDSLTLSDIPGTSVNSLWSKTPRETSTIQCKDIQKACIGWKMRYLALPEKRADGHVRESNLNVEDVNRKGLSEASNRSLSMDVQHVKDSEGFVIEGTKAAPRTRTRMDGVNFSLSTCDIPGATPKNRLEPFYGTVPFDGKHLVQRRAEKASYIAVDDIPGARPTIHALGPPKVISRPKPEQPSLLSREAVLQNFEKHMGGGGGGDSAQAMNQHFTKVDREKCGKVDMKELSAVLSTCNVDLPPDDLKQLYAAFDTDRSGYMNYKAFTREVAPAFVKNRPATAHPASRAPHPSPTVVARPASALPSRAASRHAPASPSRPSSAVPPPARPASQCSSRPNIPEHEHSHSHFTKPRPATAHPSGFRAASHVAFHTCGSPGPGSVAGSGARAPLHASRPATAVGFSSRTHTVTGVADSALVHAERRKANRRERSGFTGDMRNAGKRSFQHSQVPGREIRPEYEWEVVGQNSSDARYAAEWRCAQDMHPSGGSGMVFTPPLISRNQVFKDYVREEDRARLEGDQKCGHHANPGVKSSIQMHGKTYDFKVSTPQSESRNAASLRRMTSGKPRPQSAHASVFRQTQTEAPNSLPNGMAKRQEQQLQADIASVRGLS